MSQAAINQAAAQGAIVPPTYVTRVLNVTTNSTNTTMTYTVTDPSHVGLIAGTVVGFVVITIVCVAIVALILHRRRRATLYTSAGGFEPGVSCGWPKLLP